MPSRLVSAVILVAWVGCTVALFRRDVLPGLLVGPPPDFRTVLSGSGGVEEPVYWNILVTEDEDGLLYHPVGEARTHTLRSRDGWINLTSHAWFDSKELMKGTPFAVPNGERLLIRSLFAIEPSGSLETFRVGVSIGQPHSEILILDGRVEGNDLVISAHGPMPLLNWKKRFPYLPHSMVQNSMGPLEYMPGLSLGQRWSSRMVSPLTGAVDEVSMVVERRRIITWDEAPVTTLEVVTRSGPLTLRTWVRPDGLVLRQEVPFPLVRLMLERRPFTSDKEGQEVARP